MSKVFGILAIVLGIWVSLEIVNHGVSGAFGGMLGGERTPAATPESVGQRAGSAVAGAHSAGEDRRARMLGD